MLRCWQRLFLAHVILYFQIVRATVFNFTGNEQQFQVPAGSTYIFQVFGGAGGSSASNYAGGNGGHVTATCTFNQDTTLSIYVGGTTTSRTGGYPYGANGGYVSDTYYGGGGGGNTYINDGDVSVLIAGGGGGAGMYGAGGDGGGINGSQDGSNGEGDTNAAHGGTENDEFSAGGNTCDAFGLDGDTYFGGAGSENINVNCDDINVQSAGGGGASGYFGGGGGAIGGGGGGGSEALSTYCQDITFSTSTPSTGNGYVIITYLAPTQAPSKSPSRVPSEPPTSSPTLTYRPTFISNFPTVVPTEAPSSRPTPVPTSKPTSIPSSSPSSKPSTTPSSSPSTPPTSSPSLHPSSQPSSQPSTQPSSQPSAAPSVLPTSSPTMSGGVTIVDRVYGILPSVFVLSANGLARSLRRGYEARLNTVSSIYMQLFHVTLISVGWFLYLESFFEYQSRSNDQKSNNDFSTLTVLLLLGLAKVPAFCAWLTILLFFFAPQWARFLFCLKDGETAEDKQKRKRTAQMHPDMDLDGFLYTPAVSENEKHCGYTSLGWYRVILGVAVFDLYVVKYLAWKRSPLTERYASLPNQRLVHLCLYPNALGSAIQSLASLAVFVDSGGSVATGFFVFISAVSAIVAIFEVLLVVVLSQLPEKSLISLSARQYAALMMAETIEQAANARVSHLGTDRGEHSGQGAEMIRFRRFRAKNNSSTMVVLDRESLDFTAEADDDELEDMETEETDEMIAKNPSRLRQETIKLLQTVLHDAGLPAPEYMPLITLKQELHGIIEAMNNPSGGGVDVARLDYLLLCLHYHPGYLKEQAVALQQWRQDNLAYLEECHRTMLSFVPVEVFSARNVQAFLTESGIPTALAKRIVSKKCLWLIRMSAVYLERLHIAELTGAYNPAGQQLDVVELAAIVYSLPESFTSDPNGKKEKWRRHLEETLQEWLIKKAAGSLTKRQLRHPVYKDQVLGPFAGRESVFFNEAERAGLGADPEANEPRLSGTLEMLQQNRGRVRSLVSDASQRMTLPSLPPSIEGEGNRTALSVDITNPIVQQHMDKDGR